MIFAFSSHDLKIRYKNSVLGFFWTFLEPLLLLTVLYIVFTNLLKPDIEHYQLYLFLGIIMWNTFSRATSTGMNAIVQREGVVKQIYFPREILVISSCLTAFYMMGFELIIFVIYAIFLQFIPFSTIIIFPVILILFFMLTLGISFILSVFLIKFRDMQSIWTVVLSAGFFLAPIIYSIEIFPDTIRNYLLLNPFVPILDISHKLVLYGIWPSLDYFIQIVFDSTLILFVGYWIFKKLDKKIVERI